MGFKQTKRDAAEQLPTTRGFTQLTVSNQTQEKAAVLKKSPASSAPESFLANVHQDRRITRCQLLPRIPDSACQFLFIILNYENIIFTNI